MTGYYMRLLEGEPPQQHCTYCEKHTAEIGRYNILLTGAAFFDKDLMFKVGSGKRGSGSGCGVSMCFSRNCLSRKEVAC